MRNLLCHLKSAIGFIKDRALVRCKKRMTKIVSVISESPIISNRTIKNNLIKNLEDSNILRKLVFFFIAAISSTTTTNIQYRRGKHFFRLETYLRVESGGNSRLRKSHRFAAYKRAGGRCRESSSSCNKR